MLSSVVGHMPVPNMAAYSASKGFMLLFGEGLYGELKDSGIDVLAVAPGDTITEFRSVSGMKTAFALPVRTADQVARTTLRSLGRKPSVTDGFLNKFFVIAAKFFPRKWLILINKSLWKID